MDQAPVIQGQGIARLVPEHPVQVPHRGVEILEFIMQQRPVEIRQGAGAVQFDGLVHVRQGLRKLLLRRIQLPAPDIALRIETVQRNGLVVVVERPRGIGQVKPGGAAVQVRGRILRLPADIPVEIFHSLIELPGQQVGNPAAEIQSGIARTQIHRMLEILKCQIVIAETGLCDAPVMVSVGKDGIQADRRIEIAVGAPQVTQVVLGDAPEEKRPVVRRIQAGENVELLDRLGILSLRKGLSAPEIKHVPVVLRVRGKSAAQKHDDKEQVFP